MSTKVYVVLLTQFEEAYGPEYCCENKFFGVYASRWDAMDAIQKDCDEYLYGPCSWIKLIYDSYDRVTLVNEWDEVVARYDILKQSRSMKGETFSWTLHPKESIRTVIFNEPATIVFWEDDTKTVVKCNQNEEYDPEKGLAMAIAKKYLGNQGNYYDVFRDNLKKYKPFKPEVSQCHSRDVVEELIEDGILKGTALDEYDELYQNDDRDYEDSEMWAPFYREDGIPTDVEVSTYGRVRKKKTLKEVRQFFVGPKLYFTYKYDDKSSTTATDLAVIRCFVDPTIKARSRRIVHLGSITDNNVNNLTVLK